MMGQGKCGGTSCGLCPSLISSHEIKTSNPPLAKILGP